MAIFVLMLLQAQQSAGFLQKINDIDHALFFKINGSWHNSFFDLIFPFTREAFFWGPFYLFLFLFVSINFKKYGLWWAIFMIVTAAVSDFISSSVIKEFFFRLRPCNDASVAEHIRFLVKYCPQSSSFTSSHAVNHFAAAMFIFATLRQKFKTKWLALIFIWAAIPCYAQIYVGVHFLGDILAGMVLGLFIGFCMAYLFKKIAGKLNL